jgi:Arc/MetJ family transcription regulator
MERCMRTNIDIDDELLEKAAKALGTKTKKATVEAALEQVIRRHAQSRVLELYGTVEWEGDLDEMRRSREFPR